MRNVLNILYALVISRRARYLAWIILSKRKIPRRAGILFGALVAMQLAWGVGSWVYDTAGDVLARYHESLANDPHIPPTPQPQQSPTLPLDSPQTALQDGLLGPTATALGLIGIVTVFGILIMGGELNHFSRSLCFLILLLSVMITGSNMLATLGVIAH